MKIADIAVTYLDHCGSDLKVANAARVSFNKESEWNTSPDVDGPWLKSGDEKLIGYLAEHKHFSPFNHCFLSFRVKAPIFVARQMVKHKFLPWNEVSRRYVDDEPEFYIPKDWRTRAVSVKQGSSEETVPCYIDYHINSSLELYNSMLEHNIAPEMARMVLPQNMMTEWWWSGSLGAFCDMLRLRLYPHAQLESQIVAKKILEIVSPLFPVSVAALLGDLIV